MYDDVRRAASPRQALLSFLQSTYEAAANLATLGPQGTGETIGSPSASLQEGPRPRPGGQDQETKMAKKCKHLDQIKVHDHQHSRL